MQTHSRRISPRKHFEAPIQYLYLQQDRYYNSSMYNFSQDGLYFESFQPLALVYELADHISEKPCIFNILDDSFVPPNFFIHKISIFT